MCHLLDYVGIYLPIFAWFLYGKLVDKYTVPFPWILANIFLSLTIRYEPLGQIGLARPHFHFRDHIRRNFIFQPSIFGGYVSVSGVYMKLFWGNAIYKRWTFLDILPGGLNTWGFGWLLGDHFRSLEEARRSMVNLFVASSCFIGDPIFSLMVHNKKQPVLKAHTFGGLL